jgi:hypothetical protein
VAGPTVQTIFVRRIFDLLLAIQELVNGRGHTQPDKTELSIIVHPPPSHQDVMLTLD